MYHLVFYVPETHAELVKKALFEAGAGKLGAYDQCSFETKGIGQFRPLEGSSPFVGKRGEVETVIELKVEMICKKDCLSDVVRALKNTHPYETPAYYATEMVNI